MICVGEEKKKVALTGDRGGTLAVEDVAELLLQAVGVALRVQGDVDIGDIDIRGGIVEAEGDLRSIDVDRGISAVDNQRRLPGKETAEGLLGVEADEERLNILDVVVDLVGLHLELFRELESIVDGEPEGDGEGLLQPAADTRRDANEGVLFDAIDIQRIGVADETVGKLLLQGDRPFTFRDGSGRKKERKQETDFKWKMFHRSKSPRVKKFRIGDHVRKIIDVRNESIFAR